MSKGISEAFAGAALALLAAGVVLVVLWPSLRSRVVRDLRNEATNQAPALAAILG